MTETIQNNSALIEGLECISSHLLSPSHAHTAWFYEDFYHILLLVEVMNSEILDQYAERLLQGEHDAGLKVLGLVNKELAGQIIGKESQHVSKDVDMDKIQIIPVPSDWKSADFTGFHVAHQWDTGKNVPIRDTYYWDILRNDAQVVKTLKN